MRSLCQFARCLLGLMAMALHASFTPKDIHLQDYVVDAPEIRLMREKAGESQTLVLSQLHNKVFLYAFEDAEHTRHRLWKSPPLILQDNLSERFGPDREDIRPNISFSHCNPDEEWVVLSHTPLLTYKNAGWRYPQLIAIKHHATGFHVLRMTEKVAGLEITSSSPLDAAEQRWVRQFLDKRQGSVSDFPSQKRGDPPLFRLIPEPDGNRALARIHARASAVRGSSKDKKLVEAIERFLLDFDVRELGRNGTVLLQINDLAFWLGESERPMAALFLLDEVLQRDPERAVALLNRGDLRFALAQRWESEGQRRLALEDYRHYVRNRLAAGIPIPSATASRLKGRLGLTELTLDACRSRFEIFRCLSPADRPRLKELLASKRVDPNELNGKAQVPLVLAFQNNDMDLIRLLLDHGADPNGCDGRTPLLSLVAEDLRYRAQGTQPDFTLMDLLLSKGAAVDPVFQTWKGPTSLLMETLNTSRIDLPLVNYLLSHGANAAYKNPNGLTPLWVAISNEQPVEVIQLLLARGADPNVVAFDRTTSGCTPLMRILFNLKTLERSVPDYRRVKLLLEAGADLSLGGGEQATDRLALNQNLGAAVSTGYSEVLELVLAHAQVRAGDLDAGPMNKIGYLLGCIEDRRGDQAADQDYWAARLRDAQRMMARLLALGADPNLGKRHRGNGGYDSYDSYEEGEGSMAFFPLLEPADIESLLGKGLDPTLRNKAGILPIIAYLKGARSLPMVRALLSRPELYWRDPDVAGWVATDLMAYLKSCEASSRYQPDTPPAAVWDFLKELEKHPCNPGKAFARGYWHGHSGWSLAQELGFQFQAAR